MVKIRICNLFLLSLFILCIQCFIRIPLEKRYSSLVSRNLKSISSEDGTEVDLFGNLEQTHIYYTTIYVGNQPFSVLIDTGSVNLGIPDENCHLYENPTDSKAVGTCPAANNYYIPSDNSTLIKCQSGCALCQDHNCWFSVSYSDSSYIRGPLVYDNVKLNDLEVNMLFGAIERESPHFSIGSCDGILGFAFSDLDSNDGDSFIDNLVTNELIEENIFSLCFGENAGEIFLGGYDPALDAGPIYYTNLVAPYDYYRIQLEDIKIGKFSIGISASDYEVTIIDSGTSLIELESNIWDAFVATFISQFPNIPHIDSSVNIFTGICFTDINLRLYPTLTFNIDGIDLDITPYQYMIPSISFTGDECLSLAVTEASGSKSILGIAFMQGYNIIFDRQSFQIGFAFLQSCADVAFISGISQGDGISVDAGESFELKVEVQYLITHNPVVGIIVEFVVVKGSSDNMISGVATDENGIATFNTYLTTNGTSFINALVPGSLSPVLQFTIHVNGELPSSFDTYTPFYSPWKQENTNFILGIPTWVILTIFGVFLLAAILLTGFMATMAVRHFRDNRFGTKKDFGVATYEDSDYDSDYLILDGEYEGDIIDTNEFIGNIDDDDDDEL